MELPVRNTATIDDDILTIGAEERLDFRAGPHHEDEGDGELPPAWGVDVESYAVGYQPVGATSVGTASERNSRGRYRYLRAPDDRLSKLNEGRHRSEGNLSARLARLDKKRITQAYCSELAVTAFQRDEAVRAMLLLDLDVFGQHKRIEKVALTVIKIVVTYNRYAHLRKKDAPRISQTDEFKKLAEAVELDTRTMRRLSRRIKEELREVDFFEKDYDRSERRQQPAASQYRTTSDSPGQRWPLQYSD